MILKYVHCSALLLAVIFLTFNSFGQQKFDPSSLNAPIKNGDAVAKKFVTTEVYEYDLPTENAIVLNNGFRKHGFENANEWLKIKDSVHIEKVQIVFSKYPIRNGVYNEIYPLLFNRIKATINLDPNLNRDDIVWERVWQTHCENNDQVNEIYHGVVIHHITPKKTPKIKQETGPIVEQIVKPKDPVNEIPTVNEEQKMSPIVEYMLNHPSTPETLKKRVSNLPPDEAEEEVLEYFQNRSASSLDGPITDPMVQLNYMFELEKFARQFPSPDSAVSAVLTRHPEWEEKIVINDWTGSMYGYGSQVVLWHLMNLERSGITTLTLFNDGDNKSTSQKKIGKTGGIYSADANSPKDVLDLFNSVMSAGGGGDGPENDIEAILEAIENSPNGEVILIADNSACVRDISLADQIDRPVRVILCGYKPSEGVNPDYVYLASAAGGGIYTIEEDLEQLNANLDENGVLNYVDDDRFKIATTQCLQVGREFTLKKARWRKKKVYNLNASQMELNAIPNYVYKMKKMQRLDVSGNYISEIDPSIAEMTRLNHLNLSNNRLDTLPKQMKYNKFLEHLILDSNQFETIIDQVYELKFLWQFSVAHNELNELGKFDARTLESIDVSHNNLSKLPSLSRQKELNFFNASHNNLTAFPERIRTKKLKELDVSFNNISQLPDDLVPYQNLKKLNLQGNPISTGERIRIRQALFNVDLTF